MAFNKEQAHYKALRNIISERTSKILSWVGSGLSAPAGIPTWEGLKSILLSQLHSMIETGEENEKKKLSTLYYSIKAESNYWLSFRLLRESLGKTTYRSTIKENISCADSIQVPDIYRKIWSLKVSGIINLNLDRLASKAFYEVNDSSFTEFNASNIKDYIHVLKSPYPYLINLHGRHDDVSSWIFTDKELNHLFEDQAYNTFLQTCIATNVIIFLGISADDKSVGGHFEKFSKLNMDTGNHFWITHRNDSETREWAEEVGIRLIYYCKDKDGQHSELSEIFDDLLSYIPEEETTTPVISDIKTDTDEHLPPVSELMTYDAEKIRKLLNVKAKEILESDAERINYDEYNNFCKEYDEPIYRAWYTSVFESKNLLFDNELIEEVAKGAFGRVYRSYSPDGKQIAIKVLLEEVRNYPESLQCFRRGIRSMRILANNKIDGMVGYREAAEIPACVIMDWIEGPNLKDAVKSKMVESWDEILKIGSSLASIIYEAHRLPERVLHRDLRPSNIMLKNFYLGDWDVVVLDFDLSWHRGSKEKSVNHSSGDTGYLAPEQIKMIPKVSTRHASVDSFGIGMVLFFLLNQESPMPLEHKHKEYAERIFGKAKEKNCSDWNSIPKRFASLILNCTKEKQSERWDMGQIRDELERLYNALLDPDSVKSTDMITEELVARTNYKDDYCWDPDKRAAHIKLVNGLNMSLQADESNRRILLNMTWDSSSDHEIKRIRKWLPNAISKTISLLKKNSWENIDNTKPDANSSVSIYANINTDIVRGDINKYASCIDEICTNLRLE